MCRHRFRRRHILRTGRHAAAHLAPAIGRRRNVVSRDTRKRAPRAGGREREVGQAQPAGNRVPARLRQSREFPPCIHPLGGHVAVRISSGRNPIVKRLQRRSCPREGRSRWCALPAEPDDMRAYASGCRNPESVSRRASSRHAPARIRPRRDPARRDVTRPSPAGKTRPRCPPARRIHPSPSRG